MHELIDREYPVCLYCGSQCDTKFSGELLPRSNYQYNVDILTCQACGEVFEIHAKQSAEGETQYLAFSFTCKDYYVYCGYNDKSLYIGKNPESLFDEAGNFPDFIIGLSVAAVILPKFQVNFSNKNKLFEKLKTYIIFS
jgi:hypothetical protein